MQDDIAGCHRQLRHCPTGPGQFPTARSLASSPRISSANRPPPAIEPSRQTQQSGHGRQRYNDYGTQPELQLPILPGPPTRNSDSSLSSSFSDRRTSLASVATTTTFPGTRRGSPVLPNLSRGRTPEHLTHPHGDASDPRGMPSLYGNRERSAYGREQAPLSGGLRRSVESYPSSSQTYPVAPVEPPYHPAYGGGTSHHLSYADRQPVDALYLRENGRNQRPVNFESAEIDQHRNHKRRRGNLPKAVTDTLRQWFQEHVANPYPTEDEKQMLMDRTGLTISQVSLYLGRLVCARNANLDHRSATGSSTPDGGTCLK